MDLESAPSIKVERTREHGKKFRQKGRQRSPCIEVIDGMQMILE